MSNLTNRINASSPELFDDLDPQTTAKVMTDATPVLATPAAVAAGVAVTGAFVAGYAVEEAGDN